MLRVYKYPGQFQDQSSMIILPYKVSAILKDAKIMGERHKAYLKH